MIIREEEVTDFLAKVSSKAPTPGGGAAAALRATAAIYGALENVRINLESLKDEKFCQKMKAEIEEILGCEDLKTG